MNKLAPVGGTPVRAEPMGPTYIGRNILGTEELELLTEVIASQAPFRDYAYGEGVPHMVDNFEALAREYFDTPFALATATGSGSYYCALAAIGIGPGDEVIIPAFAWHTDFMAPVMFGALPVFADINHSMNMDPDDFERKITPATKAVIVVHFQGASYQLARIIEIAARHNIKVIEDNAQACGAEIDGKKLGTFGDIGCFSFQQNKILTTGDGGLLLTKDPVLFERAVRFHDLGGVRKSLSAQLSDQLTVPRFCGCQFRMNELTGAVALAQLRKLDSHILNITRGHHRQLKKRLLQACPTMKYRPVDDAAGDAGIAFYMNLETPEYAQVFSEALVAEGIWVGPSSGCCNLLHLDVVQAKTQVHPALPPFGPGYAGENIEYKIADCPNTDKINDSMCCVTLSPTMSIQEFRDIGTAIIKVWKLFRTFKQSDRRSK